MPRKRQTQSGDPALAVQSVPGRRYGEGVESQALQRALPAPDRSTPVAPSLSPSEPGSGAPPVAQSVAERWAAQLAAAQQIQSPGLLTQPTTRPNEPVTAGLRRGPGAGPEVLSAPQGNRSGRWLRELSAITGDPYFANLANRSRM